jgi:hypothetical protein
VSLQLLNAPISFVALAKAEERFGKSFDEAQHLHNLFLIFGYECFTLKNNL